MPLGAAEARIGTIAVVRGADWSATAGVAAATSRTTTSARFKRSTVLLLLGAGEIVAA
jgi:hypothetical protein